MSSGQILSWLYSTDCNEAALEWIWPYSLSLFFFFSSAAVVLGSVREQNIKTASLH